MNYEILASFRFQPEHPIIRLKDGTVICQTGQLFYDLGYYALVEVELPVPPDHAMRCEMLYQSWMADIIQTEEVELLNLQGRVSLPLTSIDLLRKL